MNRGLLESRRAMVWRPALRTGIQTTMQKIPTMFVRDESRKGHPIIDQVKPECQWVLDGEGITTAKIDGTNVKVVSVIGDLIANPLEWSHQLLKRQKPLEGDYDEASYVPCDFNDPANQWAREAFDRLLAGHPNTTDHSGIYELVGPKVQGNPHGYHQHELVLVYPNPVGLQLFHGVGPRTFTELRDALKDSRWEGFVFHHPDGRLAKIKRRDFGLPWPPR